MKLSLLISEINNSISVKEERTVWTATLGFGCLGAHGSCRIKQMLISCLLSAKICSVLRFCLFAER